MCTMLSKYLAVGIYYEHAAMSGKQSDWTENVL